MNEVSLVCCKKITKLKNCKGEILDIYTKFYEIGNIYEFEINFDNIQIEIINDDFFSYANFDLGFYFHKNEIDEYFLTLEKWRELKINKILKNG